MTRTIKTCLALLATVCCTLPGLTFGQQTQPKPDGYTQVAVPPIVTPKQARPETDSNMLAPVQVPMEAPLPPTTRISPMAPNMLMPITAPQETAPKNDVHSPRITEYKPSLTAPLFQSPPMNANVRTDTSAGMVLPPVVSRLTATMDLKPSMAQSQYANEHPLPTIIQAGGAGLQETMPQGHNVQGQPMGAQSQQFLQTANTVLIPEPTQQSSTRPTAYPPNPQQTHYQQPAAQQPWQNAPMQNAPMQNARLPFHAEPTRQPNATSPIFDANVATNQTFDSGVKIVSQGEIPTSQYARSMTPPMNNGFVQDIEPIIQGVDAHPMTVVEQPLRAPGENDYFTPGAANTPMEITNGCGNPHCSGCNGTSNESFIASQCGLSGGVSSSRDYMYIDAMYMTRADGDIQGSTFFGVNDFGEDAGWRVTLGHRYDQANGVEFTYWGTAEISERKQELDALARLAPNFISGGSFTGIETSAFRNGIRQTQQKETMFHSTEYHRTRWHWDVLKTHYGLRYIHFDDKYSYFSENIGGETGTLSMRSRNNLFGTQIGGELFYDTGCRVSHSFILKGGGFINLGELETKLTNNNFNFIDRDDEETSFAWVLELGFMSHVRLNDRARFRFGYNALLMWDVVTNERNFPFVMSQFSGSNAQTNDDAVIFHGLNFGFEIFR